jgi:MFS family permease
MTEKAAPDAEPEITARKVLIAAVCLLGSTFVPYVQATIGPLMLLPMTGEFGWTRTEFAFATTFLFISGSITVLAVGKIADRFGSRAVLLFGALCGGGTMLLLSQQDEQLWRLYLAYALLGACGVSGLGYTKIIGTLFTRHRGKALAIFGAESTIALATLPLLTNALNVQFGWRGTYVVYALIMFVVAPVLYFVIRGPGLSTRSTPPTGASATPGAPPAPSMEGLSPPQVRRDSRFWIIVLSAVLGAGLNAGLQAHIIAAITDKGFTPTVAAGVLSASTFIGLIGTFAAGFAMDHFRTAKVLSIFGSSSALGYALFALASATFGGLPLLIAGLSLQRAAMSALMPGTTYVQTRFVGMRSFGEAYAMQVLVQGIAMGIAPPLFGVIYERSGSYQPVYWILCFAAVVGAVLYFALGPYRFGANAASAGPGGGKPALKASAA